VIEDFKDGIKIEINRYQSLPDPFPELVADVLVEQHSPSQRHHEKTGRRIERDRDRFASARSTLKVLQLNYLLRTREEIAQKLKTADDAGKVDLHKKQAQIQRELNKLEVTHYDDLYPSVKEKEGQEKKREFDYKMKSDRE
jgi:hypothetical protein